MYVVRAVIFDYVEEGVYTASSRGGGLDAFFGSGGLEASVKLHVLRVKRVGLLVQYQQSPDVEVVWEPLLKVDSVGGRLCRFHDGPRGDPLRQRYCMRLAVTRSGFCSLHRESWQALYEQCAQGVDSACITAARLLRGEMFRVYVLDYGGPRVKVGLTQSWRLLWRIAEQPHVAAAVVYEAELLDAREAEKRLGRHRLATEGAAARLGHRLSAAVALLERLNGRYDRAAARLAQSLSALGLEGSFNAYTVLPRSLEWITRIRVVDDIGELQGHRLRVLDYWAGMLLVEDLDTSYRLALRKTGIQHYQLEGRVASS
ncbi:hypothetical protein [Hyperthermus butylicus]|uniref:hypothetical protein n=1 Tax=Hyperthermus butylicus TaxID=54248 RepID=UPI00129B843B|nr:hypothetical protein [Hyperthermus butylicus]